MYMGSYIYTSNILNNNPMLFVNCKEEIDRYVAGIQHLF